MPGVFFVFFVSVIWGFLYGGLALWDFGFYFWDFGVFAVDFKALGSGFCVL